MPGEQHDERVDDSVAILDRWEAAGGTWRVVGRRGGEVTVSLCQCDAGTEANRLTSTSTELKRYLAARTRSDNQP